MTNIIILLLMLFIITVTHEFGHFLAARLFNVSIDTFSLGIGPKIFGIKDKKGVEWKMSMIPAGGYVSFSSEGPKYKLSLLEDIHPIKKMFIAFAGPLSNYLLAFIIFYILDDGMIGSINKILDITSNIYSNIFSSNVIKSVGSPVSIINKINTDMYSMLKLTARISIGIGFFNLIPFLFVLDGGHIIIYIFEFIFGLKSKTIIEKTAYIQYVMLSVLFIYLVVRDIYFLM